MKNLYVELKKKSGQKCFTLKQHKPAEMVVEDDGVTILYPTRRELFIPRSLFAQAFHILNQKGILTLEDVHYGITDERGPVTDRLMVVLRETPGISFTSSPRTLFLEERKMNLPPYPCNIGKIGKRVDINGVTMKFEIVDEIIRPQSDNPEKLIYLQKLKINDEGEVEYRLAYYIIGKKPRMLGKWVFGQYATMMKPSDLKFIVKEAYARGWIGAI